MRSFAARRIRYLSVFLLLAALVVGWSLIQVIVLLPAAFATGWLLLALVVGLAAYNVRKKLTFLPLGSSATWLQIHIYAGLLSCMVFLVHVGFRVPTGFFEGTLAVLYVAVFASGIGGLILSRVIPPRLATRGEEVLFERIPVFLKRLRDQVEEAVLSCLSETDTTALPSFYVERLKPFFERPRHFWRHLIHSSGPRQVLLEEIHAQRRFLNETERGRMAHIADLVCTKDDLDYHYALQWTLKAWLFVHVPLTYALLVFTVFHVVLVHAFS